MSLSPELKNKIDIMDYESMLRKCRFAPVGDPMFTGEVGDYFLRVMNEKKIQCDHVAISKRIGWGEPI